MYDSNQSIDRLLDQVRSSDNDRIIRWMINESEHPIRRLRMQHPSMSLPRDLKRMAVLYCNGRMSDENFSSTLYDIDKYAKAMSGIDRAGESLMLALFHFASSMKSRPHPIGYIRCYIKALRLMGMSEKAISKEADRMRENLRVR